eukprot:29534-Rhodomonas_salina.2
MQPTREEEETRGQRGSSKVVARRQLQRSSVIGGKVRPSAGDALSRDASRSSPAPPDARVRHVSSSLGHGPTFRGCVRSRSSGSWYPSLGWRYLLKPVDNDGKHRGT